MARGRKIRGGDMVDALQIGTAVYAAKNATSFGGFLWTFAKYALVLLGLFIVFWIVMFMLGTTFGKEQFVPIAPSKEGDERVRTPAGNLIMY
jgi:hypothetical protein